MLVTVYQKLSLLIAKRDTTLFITGCSFTLNTKMIAKKKKIQRLMDWRSCCLLSSCPKGCITEPLEFVIDTYFYVILVNILFPKAACYFYFIYILWKRMFVLICLSRLSEFMHFGIQIRFLIASFRVRFMVNNISLNPFRTRHFENCFKQIW